MKPIEPLACPAHAVRVVFAADQPQYDPLPACVTPADGLVMTEWEPSAEELHALCTGGRVRLWIHTFRRPLQPVALEVAGGEAPRRGPGAAASPQEDGGGGIEKFKILNLPDRRRGPSACEARSKESCTRRGIRERLS